ncbi:nucleoside-diphosphate sugar epimerase/dehydratase [Aliiroseovarius subalbicans]|uniref:polysaccharide biosynthesis protein n=1 Tax=Aliiroseovarius subalbicans TaxID=2925840 RepID=UPI001F55DD0F|nr:nucleoside-diphosphate sugar epimerase/dehydratase [Aliiroseovarius subalbicans]MCI2397799.1 polysaccharide biosynthesis protein [Aliiroseovarius subalbicans]
MSLVRLHALPRRTKRLIFLVADTVLIPISLYVAFALRYGTALPLPRIGDAWVLLPIMAGIGAFVVNALRLSQIKLNAFENRAVLQIGFAAGLLALLVMAISYLLNLSAPRSVPVIFGSVFFLLSVTLRVLGLHFLNSITRAERGAVHVAIYGAGAAGIQLASALRQSHEARPMVFLDDNPNLHGLMVAGLPVRSPDEALPLVARHGIKRVLVAMPSAPRARRDVIIQCLAQLDVEVQVLPSYIDLMAGKGLEDQLRAVSPDELLGRDKVDLDIPEITKAYAGRVVMVTGAGGSIGSELCRQLLECKPARIILFEQAEYQLYSIDQEMQPLSEASGVPVVARLGSVTSMARVASVIAEEGVEIILHAAAYKHVPLVEGNELEGVHNNVFGTMTVAEAAQIAGLERCILVSTDKAVRPTNVMGASKRMAEIVLQDLQTRSDKTSFSMVRFGNVLGSSGSVLPLFQKQIAAGGPVTVTHPEVTRYFMTIPEAARLVLLAGAFSTRADVFVLDMGAPKKILDLARQMISLSGRTVKDPASGIGDIAIEISGMRPGEKLYEELLIDDDSLVHTPHPKILRAQEKGLSHTQVAAMISEAQTAIEQGDVSRLRHAIWTYIDGYRRADGDGRVAPNAELLESS